MRTTPIRELTMMMRATTTDSSLGYVASRENSSKVGYLPMAKKPRAMLRPGPRGVTVLEPMLDNLGGYTGH